MQEGSWKWLVSEAGLEADSSCSGQANVSVQKRGLKSCFQIFHCLKGSMEFGYL